MLGALHVSALSPEPPRCPGPLAQAGAIASRGHKAAAAWLASRPPPGRGGKRPGRSSLQRSSDILFRNGSAPQNLSPTSPRPDLGPTATLIEKMGVLEGCVFTPSQTRSFLERKAMGAVKAATRNCRPVCPLLSGTHSHPPRHTHGARPVSQGRRPVCRRAPPRPGGSVRPRATLRPVSPQTSAPRDSASATG